MHILKRHVSEAPQGYILVSADGWYLSLTQRPKNACRITRQADAIDVAKALTGNGEQGRWTVMPAPPQLSDPNEPLTNPYAHEGWLESWAKRFGRRV